MSPNPDVSWNGSVVKDSGESKNSPRPTKNVKAREEKMWGTSIRKNKNLSRNPHAGIVFHRVSRLEEKVVWGWRDGSALAALVGNLGLIPSIHMESITPVSGNYRPYLAFPGAHT